MAPIAYWALAALLPLSALASPFDLLSGRGEGHGHGPGKGKLPTAVIDSGKLIGTTTTLPLATATVNQFLAIPYAAPPVRFAKPQKAKKWRGERNATIRGPACIQQFSGSSTAAQFTKALFNDPPPVESEDCLFLNVFAPSGEPPKGGFPILVWLYGGGLAFGNAGQPAYDGSWLAGFEDVIVVTINYRTNVFGFPGSTELGLTERNVGLYDQRFALDWVQKNIHAFRGNPKKVTIFGESAGAFSVDALVTTSFENPPFRAAILQSGQASLGRFLSRGNSTASWASLVDKTNCTSAASQLACIRALNPLIIKDVIEKNSLGFSAIGDNITVATDAQERRAARKIANVPVMIGSNAQEGRVFNVGNNNLTAYLSTTFQDPTFIAAVRAAYPRGVDGLVSDYDIISAIYTDLIYNCPGSLLTSASAAAGYDTYRYFYTASFPNLNAIDRIGIDLQAFHSSEIPMVFGTYEDPTSGENGNSTAQQVALSRYMQGAWAGFARNPVAGPGWNKVGTFNGTDLGVLGWLGSSGVTVTNRTVADKRCALYNPLYSRL